MNGIEARQRQDVDDAATRGYKNVVQRIHKLGVVSTVTTNRCSQYPDSPNRLHSPKHAPNAGVVREVGLRATGNSVCCTVKVLRPTDVTTTPPLVHTLFHASAYRSASGPAIRHATASHQAASSPCDLVDEGAEGGVEVALPSYIAGKVLSAV